MAPNDLGLPDPNSPEFASIRGDLARLFIVHKADLGLLDWSDEHVAERVNDIAGALMGCGLVALQRDDRPWLERHRWFSEACKRLFDDRAAVTLDG